MKKTIKIIIVAVVLTALLTIYAISQYDVYVLTPYMCKVAFGYSSTEFMERKPIGYTFAKFNKDENVVLVLSSYEKKMWELQSRYAFQFVVIDLLMGKNIRIDYTSFNEYEISFLNEIKSGEVKISDDYRFIEYPDIATQVKYMSIEGACMTRQIINGAKSEAVYLESFAWNNGEKAFHLVTSEDGIVLLDGMDTDQ